jgi:hypothetical protein
MGPPARLFVISCLGKPPLSQPLDHFEVHEFSTESPRELIFGSTHTVKQADKTLNRRTEGQAEIRCALARINARYRYILPTPF